MFVLLEHDTRAAVRQGAEGGSGAVGATFHPQDGTPSGSAAAALPAEVHWDFMIELAGAERLATWRLAEDPLAAAGAIAAERIGDHRRAYLEFEGEIGGGRGRVRRIDRGECTIMAQTPQRLLFELNGDRLRGRFELSADAAGRWVFRRRGARDRESTFGHTA